MKLTKQHRILIFDSGIGGLSISDEIRHLIPNISIVYAADNRVYPYGTLSEQALVERMVTLIPNLIDRFHPQAIVIACNSASTLVLDQLREVTQIPVIGVVPAIKPAAQHSESNTIGLLATPGTVRRAYTDKLIHDFAPHCQVLKIGSRELVDEAEKKLRGAQANIEIIKQAILPFLASPDIDRVVLGCTHFPFLREELNLLLGDQVQLIDSGEAIARRTKYILNAVSPLQDLQGESDYFIFTKNTDSAHQLAPHLEKHGFQHIEFIEE